MPGYGAILATVAAPERVPAVHQAIACGALDEADDMDAEFEFGLQPTLDGIDALIRASRPTRSRR